MTNMIWFSQYALIFLITLMTESKNVVGDATPWSSLENANSFVQTFLGSATQSGVFTQEQLDDMNSIGDTIMRAMGIIKGSITPNKLQALNTAFASAVAEIAMSDTGGQNVEATTNAIANALNTAFYQATGNSNDAFVSEVHSLINTFAQANSIGNGGQETEASATSAAFANNGNNPEGNKSDRPRERQSDAASAEATISQPTRVPEASFAAGPNDFYPNEFGTVGSSPRRTNPDENSAKASALTTVTEPDRVPASSSSAGGPGGDNQNEYEPDSFGPSKRTPEKASAIATISQPDRTRDGTGPGSYNPNEFGPNDSGSRGRKQKETSSRASAVATISEPRPRVSSPTSNYNSNDGYNPNGAGPSNDSGSRGRKPAETSAKASAAATIIEPDRPRALSPAEESSGYNPSEYGPDGYNPNEAGPSDNSGSKGRRPEETSAKASAAATILQSDRPRALSPVDGFGGYNPNEYGPDSYNPNESAPSDGSGSRDRNPAETSAKASAAAAILESDRPRALSPVGGSGGYNPNEYGPDGYNPNESAPSDGSGSRDRNSAETSAQASAAATILQSDRPRALSPADGSGGYNPNVNGPDGYNPNEAGQPDGFRSIGGKPAETSAKASAAATIPEADRPRTLSPADSSGGYNPNEYKPDGYNPNEARPSDNSGSRGRQPEETSAKASAAATIPEPDRPRALSPADGSGGYNPSEYEPDNFNPNEAGPLDNSGSGGRKPEETSAKASAAATIPESDRPRELSPADGSGGYNLNEYGPDGYNPNEPEPYDGSGSRGRKPAETSVKASAAATIPESDRPRALSPAEGSGGYNPSVYGPDGYNPNEAGLSDNSGSRGRQPEETSAKASAAATILESDRPRALSPADGYGGYNPNEYGPDGYNPNESAPSDGSGSRDRKPAENSAKASVAATIPESDRPRALSPDDGSGGYNPNKYGPDGYNPNEAGQPDGSGSRGRKPAETSAKASVAASFPESDRPRAISPGDVTGGYNPYEYEPEDYNPNQYGPSDGSGPISKKPVETLATASVAETVPKSDRPRTLSPDNEYGPDGYNPNGYGPSDGSGPISRKPEKTSVKASAAATIPESDRPRTSSPANGPGSYNPNAYGPDGYNQNEYGSPDGSPPRVREPDETLAQASAVAAGPSGTLVSLPITDSAGFKPNEYGSNTSGLKNKIPDEVSAKASAELKIPVLNKAPLSSPSSGPDGYSPTYGPRGKKPEEASAAASAGNMISEPDKTSTRSSSGSDGYNPGDSGKDNGVSLPRPRDDVSEAASSAAISYEPKNNNAGNMPNDKIASPVAAFSLNSPASTARISFAATNLVSSRPTNVSNLSQIIGTIVSQIRATDLGASECEVLVQALLEIITALIQILESANIENFNYDDLGQTAQMVGQSVENYLSNS